MTDLQTPNTVQGLLRRDWGLKNIIGADAGSRMPAQMQNAHRQRKVRAKIANFVQRAIYPQQLTVPRQYATTREGVFIYKVLEGREIDGIKEDGVRVIIQENMKQARFVISPLLASRFDAITWARQNMGLTDDGHLHQS